MAEHTAEKRMRSTNKLVRSPHYGNILREYNLQMQRYGKVNNKRFYEEHIKPILPDYKMACWYDFLKRWKETLRTQLITHEKNRELMMNPADKDLEQKNFEKSLLDNQTATVVGIQRALNIGAGRLKEIMENPTLMTSKEASDLLFKAMKAQDSRIHALGKVREDSREQEKFERAFGESTYAE